jgi:hypothetical protein
VIFSVLNDNKLIHSSYNQNITNATTLINNKASAQTSKRWHYDFKLFYLNHIIVPVSTSINFIALYYYYWI